MDENEPTMFLALGKGALAGNPVPSVVMVQEQCSLFFLLLFLLYSYMHTMFGSFLFPQCSLDVHPRYSPHKWFSQGY
jgi:hypothetical protein